MSRSHAGGQDQTPYVTVERVATQSLTSAVAAPIAFDTTDTDRFKMLGGTTSQLIVPKGWDGLYLAVANVTFAPISDTTKRYTWFTKNGVATLLYEVTDVNWNSASLSFAFVNTGLFRLIAGDYIEVQARQDSGGNLNVTSVPTTLAWIAP